MRENFEINIAHLYPELLDINSDFGNIQVLKKRLEWRGINVNVDKISHNDEMNYDKFDIYYLISFDAISAKIIATNSSTGIAPRSPPLR